MCYVCIMSLLSIWLFVHQCNSCLALHNPPPPPPPPPLLRMCGPRFDCHDWGWYGKTSRDAMIFTKKAKLKTKWSVHPTSIFSGDWIVLGRQLWRVDSQQKPGDAESFAYPWDHLQVSPNPTNPTLAARWPQNQIEIPQNQIKPASNKFHPPPAISPL